MHSSVQQHKQQVADEVRSHKRVVIVSFSGPRCNRIARALCASENAVTSLLRLVCTDYVPTTEAAWFVQQYFRIEGNTSLDYSTV